ncbi:MAG: hypothetical protein ACXWWN_07850 [Gemmatimonadales bacterium]
MTCRVAEGIGGMDVSGTLGLLWLATGTGASTLFSWLLLRGRMIPVALAWLGGLRRSCSWYALL